MAQTWMATPASGVQPGDRVRLGSGREMVVSRIEPGFFGRDNVVAFIEDTDERWFKQPVPLTAEVEVLTEP
jgi:hypothetical protein